MMVHGLCSELEDSIAKFVHGIGKLDEDSVSVAKKQKICAVERPINKTPDKTTSH
jgi:hypothetical protein